MRDEGSVDDENDVYNKESHMYLVHEPEGGLFYSFMRPLMHTKHFPSQKYNNL